MPNWCNNTLSLQHEDPAMIQRAVAAFKAGTLLNEFIPVPESLHITASPGTTDAALKTLYEANLAQHGYANWYDYQVAHWGTKWDVGGDDYGDAIVSQDGMSMTVSFDSAWSPPCTAMETLMGLGFSAKLFYFEPGMCFAGIWEDGNDDYYEYGSMNSEQVAEELPVELDEMFCISESMAEYEEENQDIDLDGGLSATNE